MSLMDLPPGVHIGQMQPVTQTSQCSREELLLSLPPLGTIPTLPKQWRPQDLTKLHNTSDFCLVEQKSTK